MPFAINYVLDRYETQMCNKAILENDGILESLPDWYKTQKMCDKDVGNYAHVLEFAPNCYKTKTCVIKPSMLILLQYNLFLIALRLKKWDSKLLISVLFVFSSNLDWYKTQEMCDSVVSEDPFIWMYCPINLKFKKYVMKLLMIVCLPALELIPEWFVASKMFEKFHDALLASDDTFFFDKHFGKIRFLALKWVFLV